jgi:hypothetical protein
MCSIGFHVHIGISASTNNSEILNIIAIQPPPALIDILNARPAPSGTPVVWNVHIIARW